MIIYNTTFLVDDEVNEGWVSWATETYVKEFLDTKCFLGGRLTEVTSHEEPGSKVYSLQLFCQDETVLESFKTDHLANVQQVGLKKFGTKMLAFSTEMNHLGDFE